MNVANFGCLFLIVLFFFVKKAKVKARKMKITRRVKEKVSFHEFFDQLQRFPLVFLVYLLLFFH